jgi:lipid-binding SYLF domain-containing protein
MFRYCLAGAAVAVLAASPLAAAPPPAQTLKSAVETLDELAAIPLKGIPPALLADAHGVAIIPNVIKAGLIVGGRGGHGVVLVRDRNGLWGEPIFINLGGASVGAQAGVEATDVVLVFRTRKGLDRLLEGKHKVTLGADASIAAGPCGRLASAATDASFKSEIVSYSRSRGLFAGVSLDGAAIYLDPATNAAFRRDVRPETIKLLETLKIRLSEMSAFTPPPGPRQILPPPPPFLGAPVMPATPAMPPPVIFPNLPPPPTVPANPTTPAPPPPGTPVIPVVPTAPVRP